MQNLTDKEKAIFQYIRLYVQKFSMQPSYEEIREYFMYKSTNSIFQYLKSIEKKGWIILSNKRRGVAFNV